MIPQASPTSAANPRNRTTASRLPTTICTEDKRLTSMPSHQHVMGRGGTSGWCIVMTTFTADFEAEGSVVGVSYPITGTAPVLPIVFSGDI
ncbi:hypothetical protein RvY_11886 [Ramazzottius varieornatus]|uniref:Uncharacterized protein n=1 Tax=Ramazzottius varieornatus TaxID=947166 RepID=A0A1D1VHJ0_RAMVA|nr:hypothetical protein RvY_11886 [Ramazzottius varieornatus]